VSQFYHVVGTRFRHTYPIRNSNSTATTDLFSHIHIHTSSSPPEPTTRWPWRHTVLCRHVDGMRHTMDEGEQTHIVDRLSSQSNLKYTD